jgi:acetyl-CoA acyltransferase
MPDAYIAGVGMIRFAKYPDRTVRDMAEEAIKLVLEDAKLAAGDIEAVYFSNTFWGMFANQHSIRGQVIMRGLGVDKIPVVNVENACAGASTALYLACMDILSGAHDLALVVGSEKITNPDKMLSLSAYAAAMDVENFEKHMQEIQQIGKTFKIDIPQDASRPGEGRSVFMDAYAMGARWHMNKYHSTQRQLAVICSKNHRHGSLNPLAQYQGEMSVEEVLADRPVTYPLTRAMCAPVGDGAAAAIVCSHKRLKKMKDARAVKIRASVLGQGSDRDLDGEDIGERLSKEAYKAAGLGPRDIDLAELHDATSWAELHQSEVMGFCPEGEGGPFAESGATRIGGNKPINTSGGLECRGHPIGASGLAQIYELVTQLRGDAGPRQVEKARIGLAENGGGNIVIEEAIMCVHILEKTGR